MHTLSERELQTLRLAIFDNAEALHREADLLLKHGMYSRAYLLAHLCFEELGKIPIVVGVIDTLKSGATVDWKKVKRRFSNHEEKIASQNGHLYAFGSEVNHAGGAGVQWLVAANRAVTESYQKKNLSTYVDARQGKILRPSDEISARAATELVALAFRCLRAHWRSEGLTNPIIYEAEERMSSAEQSSPNGSSSVRGTE
jgi:AbiV family abortive infection protein